jgi:predicted glycoside hydrolase/deacetylase ChbG (UPF0249 family)
MSFARQSPGRPASARGAAAPHGRIVFHADDFGMNRAVTDGIVRGFQHGLLTATSLLANAPDAARAIGEWQRLGHEHATGRLPSSPIRHDLREPEAPFELGVHLNLTQGRPLTSGYPAELLDDRGRFVGVGRLFAALHRRRPHFEPALLAELTAQVGFLCDHGFAPTHLNGHQYIELLPGLRPVLHEILRRHRIPVLRLARESGLRRTTIVHEFRPSNWCVAHVKRFYAGRLKPHVSRWGIAVPDAYFGTSHAGRINLDVMRLFLRASQGRGLSEIGVHPAVDPSWEPAVVVRLSDETHEPIQSPLDDRWHDPLAAHRPQELAMLTSPLLADLLSEFGLSLGRLRPLHSTAARRAA